MASLGKWSSTTDAAIVMGSVASASGSGGAEEGEGGDGDAVGDGEAMLGCCPCGVTDDRMICQVLEIRCELPTFGTDWSGLRFQQGLT